MVLRLAGEGNQVVDNRPRAMPNFLVVFRHGQSLGQAADKNGPGSPEYEQVYGPKSTLLSSEWPITRLGFRQGLRLGEWFEDCLPGSHLLPTGVFERTIIAPYTRVERTLGAVAVGAFRRRNPGIMSQAALRAVTEEMLSQVRIDMRLDADTYRIGKDARLREMDFGLVSTITKEEFEEKYREAYNARLRDPMYIRTPHGESPVDVIDRARSVTGALSRFHDAGTESLLVGTSGRFMGVLDSVLTGRVPQNTAQFKQMIPDVDNAEAFLYSCVNPADPTDQRRSYRWRASVVPWKMPRGQNIQPQWEEFTVPNSMTIADLLGDTPSEWLLDDSAGT